MKSTSLKILMELIRLSACHWDWIAMAAAREGTDHDLLTISGTVLHDHLWANQHLCFRAFLLYRVWILYWWALHQLVATCLELRWLVRCWNLAPLLVLRRHILLLSRCAVHCINGTLCHSAKVILMLLTLLNLLLKLVGGRVSTNPLHWLPLGANSQRANAPIWCDLSRSRLLRLVPRGDLVASSLVILLLLLTCTVYSLRGGRAAVVADLLALSIFHGCCRDIEPIMHTRGPRKNGENISAKLQVERSKTYMFLC